MANIDYEQQLAHFIETAEKLGIADDFLFASTLERYQTLVELAQRMREEIKGSELTTEKSYSAGTSNLYTSPLLGEFNRTCASADRACSLLAKLIDNARKNTDQLDEDDEL